MKNKAHIGSSEQISLAGIDHQHGPLVVEEVGSETNLTGGGAVESVSS
jgi:hypothetical protein